MTGIKTKEQISALNEASELELGSPHEVIAASQCRIFGRSSEQIGIRHAVA